jgi:signal peptidase I
VQRIYTEVVEWVGTGWSAVFLASFLMYTFVQAFEIPSGSMRVTLLEGDRLFVNKCAYGFHVPFTDGKRCVIPHRVQRGDIVVFRAPVEMPDPTDNGKYKRFDLVKRCVAVGGDTVAIVNKVLYVNGKPVVEPYAQHTDPRVYPTPHFNGTAAEYQRLWESRQFANVPYEALRDNFGPITVPQGSYFGLGDNRDNSNDCRYWGPIPDKEIKGARCFATGP